MTLQGNLADIGAVDLIQFPQSGRKSGELVLATQEQEAHLYYERGQLVHAALGSCEGLDVLVEIFGWSDAEFFFTSGATAPIRSIHLDLPRALMSALKIRDDRLAAEQRGSLVPGAAEEARRVQLATIVARFVSSTPHVVYSCVFDGAGEMRAESGGISGGVDDLERLKESVQGLVAGHPRGVLDKLFLIDASGTVAASRLHHGGLVMVIASERAPLGAVSVAVTKLCGAIGQMDWNGAQV